MNRKLIILTFALPTLALVSFVLLAKLRGPPDVPPGVSPGWKPATDVNPDYRTAISNWTAAEFASLDLYLQDTLDSISVTKDRGQMTRDQESGLKESLTNLVHAFSSGAFQDYMRFRTPVTNYTYNSDTIKWLREQVKRHYRRKDEALPSSSAAIVRMYWERCFQGGAFSNYWQGIALSDSRILIEKRGSEAPNLAFYALSNRNAGVVSFPPTFDFDSTPRDALREDHEILYATISLLVRTKPPDPAHPIHCRFFWSKTYSKWLPIELVSSYTGPRKVDILF